MTPPLALPLGRVRGPAHRELSSPAAAGVLAAWGVLMHVCYRKERRRQAAEAAAGRGERGTAGPGRDRSLVLLRRERWADSPLCACVCENGAAARAAMTLPATDESQCGSVGSDHTLQLESALNS